jgi:putative ABC transport system permease protein
MDRLLLSLRYTIRLLLKSPGFTVTAILILGFGIGMNTAMFSLIQTVVVNALPFPNSDRLVHVSQPRENDRYWSLISYPDYVDISRSNHSFDVLALSGWDFLDLSSGPVPERLTAIYATPSLFQLTNLPFLLGRPFTADEDKSGGPLLVVLSESLWRNRFNADSNIIGKNLILSGLSFQVIGICPRQAEDVSTPPGDTLYVPRHVSEVFGDQLDKRDRHNRFCMGRLKKGVTLSQAQAELGVIQTNLAACYPDAEKGYGIRAESFLDLTVSSYATTVCLLGGAVGCLLLISSANVANLLFVRALARRREMIIRSTLGASRLRLIGQLLLETAFLSLMGGFVGSLIAWLAIEFTKKVSPEDFHRFQEVRLDGTAFLFVVGLTVLVALLSGVFPAWRLSHANLDSALKDEGGRGGTVGPLRQRLQSLLVVSQVTLACVLLIGAGLLVRSFDAAYNLPMGFNAQQLLSSNITPTSKKYTDDPSQLFTLWDEVLDKTDQLPGVTAAAMNSEQPYEWTFGDPNRPFQVLGQPEAAPGREPTMCAQAISSGYFQTMQIPFLQGRDFDSGDRADSRKVIIVDVALARHFFPGEDPIGKQIIDLGQQSTWTIIGVVQNSRHNRPENPTAPFQTYFPYRQAVGLFRQFLLLRTTGDPATLIPLVRKLVASVDPEVLATPIMTFDDLMVEKFATQRLGALLVVGFSTVALFLSAVGLYGFVAYSVSQRRREIGVRIALGAQATTILRLVVRQGLMLVGVGIVVGIAVALILVRFIEGILYGVSATDPFSLCAAIIVLGLAALVACLLPALRATRINAITALRE